MSTSFLKGNGTRYRNLLETELKKAKRLIEEDAEQYKSKVFQII